MQKLQFSYQQLEVGHKNEYVAFVAHKILEPPIIFFYMLVGKWKIRVAST